VHCMADIFDENPWKWAPILLLAPMPVAIFSTAVVMCGHVVLSTASMVCYNAADRTQKDDELEGVVIFVVVAVALAYAFLAVYAWIFLGFSVQVKAGFTVLGRRLGWPDRDMTVLRPISSLRTVFRIYAVLAFAAVVTSCYGAFAVTVAVDALCTRDAPALLSFATFIVILSWIGFSIIFIRLGGLTFGRSLAAKWRELSDAADEDDGQVQFDDEGNPIPRKPRKKKRKRKIQSDLDMLEDIFDKFDKSGDGRLESEELMQFMGELGFDIDEQRVRAGEWSSSGF